MQRSDAERQFVSAYIVRNRRERILMELESKSKRNNCIWRFAHSARELLRDEFVREVGFQRGELLLGHERLLDKTGNPDVYIMQSNSYLDGKMMQFEAALDVIMGSGPYILLECDGRFAFIETESDCETHEYMFLEQKIRE